MFDDILPPESLHPHEHPISFDTSKNYSISELIENILELDIDEANNWVALAISNMIDADDNITDDLSDIVFCYFENLIRCGLTDDVLKLLAKCSYESFPTSNLGSVMENLLDISLDTSAPEVVQESGISIITKLCCVHPEWICCEHAMNHAITLASDGSFAIRKLACDALVEISGQCTFEFLECFINLGVVMVFGDILNSELDTESSLKYIDCMSELMAQSFQLEEGAVDPELLECGFEVLEMLSSEASKDVAEKALSALALLEDYRDD